MLLWIRSNHNPFRFVYHYLLEQALMGRGEKVLVFMSHCLVEDQSQNMVKLFSGSLAST